MKQAEQEMFTLKYQENETHVTLYLAGRIDSGNVGETEKEVFRILEEHSGKVPVLDASELDYISSAGLRLLMKLRKSSGANLTIKEVSPEVYSIFETTGFTELFDVRRRLREISVEGCDCIGQGFYGKVYRLDPETIVKVYESPDALSMIENEKRMAKTAFLLGIPTAISYDIVRVGESYGSVFEMLHSETFNDLIRKAPSESEDILRRYVDFIRQVHSVEAEPGVLPSARERFLGDLETIRPLLDENRYARLRELLQAAPEVRRIVHGDLQMKNVMLLQGEPVLIDMDTLSAGHPVFDLQGLYVTYQAFGEDEPDNTRKFLGLDQSVCDTIWEKILEYYFQTEDKGILEPICDKIRVVACIRFLYLLSVSELGRSELGKIRIARTKEHLDELLSRVDRLDF